MPNRPIRKKVALLWLGIGVAALFPPMAQAGEFQSSSAPDFPPGSPFGIIRFETKRVPPPFSLKNLKGKDVTLQSCKGKPILLSFWATWCPSCRAELPVLDKFAEGKEDQVVLLTLAIDGENEARIKNFVEENRIKLPVLLDVKEKVARSYGVKMIPVTFFIDREGFLVGMVVGERDWSSPEAWPAIKSLLGIR